MLQGWRRRLATGVALLASTVIWCDSAAAQPVSIPVILPLTGGASFLGTHELQAMQLALKAFNAQGGIHGRPAQFVVQDDQSTPQVAVQLSAATIATHPPIVIGSTLVALCNAMSPLFQNGPVEYCLSPAIHPKPGGYIFSSSVNFDDLVTPSVAFLRNKNLTRLGAIYSIDASGQDIEKANDAALNLAANAAMKMTGVGHYNPTDVSVAAQMERIKELDPQAFLAWSPGAQVATVFKGLLDAGLQVPAVTTSANMTYAQMNQYAHFLPKELYIPSTEWMPAPAEVPLDPRVESAHRAMNAALATIGEKPDEPAVLGWEAATLVLHVLSTLPESPNAAQLRDAIAHLKNYPGVEGVYDFEETPQRGLSAENVVMTRWDPEGQAFVMVSRPGTAEPIGQNR